MSFLASLQKWATSQAENFTTEAFANLVKLMLWREPDGALRLLRKLTGWGTDFPEPAAKVRVETQVRIREGRPDIAIDARPGHFCFVEVKVEAKPGPDQLERYQKALTDIDARDKKLVLLTRYPPGSDSNAVCRRWHEVAGYLDQESFRDSVVRFVAEDFLAFLRERGMTLEPVTHDLESGVRSLKRLSLLLAEALAAQGLSVRKNGSTSYWGFETYLSVGVDPDSLTLIEVSVGVYLDSPTLIEFEVHKPPANAIEITQRGRFKDGKFVLDYQLGTEFFEAKVSDQQIKLEEFIGDCCEVVKGLDADSEQENAPK